jgi:hypothetical protein
MAVVRAQVGPAVMKRSICWTSLVMHSTSLCVDGSGCAKRVRQTNPGHAACNGSGGDTSCSYSLEVCLSGYREKRR